jgi:GTP-binding protein
MTPVRLPTVVVVGRQNVGKSTLLNRLHGRREAIAHPMAGVTRDRVEVEVSWRSRTFALVDTGGYVQGAEGIEALVTEQARRAAVAADVIVLVCDARTGPTAEDEQLARSLRRLAAPVLVVANKVDSAKDEADAVALHTLGLGEPVAVSALHGRGSGDLLDRIVALLPDTGAVAETEPEPRFALVGRPNVGKSSLFNRLVGEERSVVFEEAGTTRDSVDAVVQWESGPVRFVDTAGLRRQSRTRGVEYFSLVRTMEAIERAHVAMLVIDASEGVTQEDKRIASEVMEAGRALAIAANKWDLIEEKDKLFKDISEIFIPFAGAPVLRTSALARTGVKRVPATLLELNDRWLRRLPTARVNEVLERAQGERPAPRGMGRYRYATQVSASPPTFVLFGGKTPDGSYRRFLEGRLRRAFDLGGVPIRLKFRARERRER